MSCPVWQPTIAAVKDGGGPNLFLDIVFTREINGIQLASKIRDYDPDGFIVYVTVRDDMIPDIECDDNRVYFKNKYVR